MNTILWLHGFPLTSRVFEKQRAIRGAKHLMPELPALDSVDDYARFAVSQLDANGIEKATIAGLSMGGYICFAMVRLFPERVGGLILLDTRETADTDEARKGRYDSIARVEQQGVQAVADAMLPKMVASDELKPAVREIMMSTSPEYVKAALRAMATRPDSSSLLPAIAVPTLVIVGEEDTITPPADAERMASAIPGAKLVKIPGAGHLSNFEKPDAVNAAIEKML
jgi:3-oxoadipate enol-lactonase